MIFDDTKSQAELRKEKFIKKFKPKTYKEFTDSHNIKLDECVICTCKFEDNQEIIELCCNKLHIFHSPCIISWIQNKSTCPLCRIQLMTQNNENDALLLENFSNIPREQNNVIDVYVSSALNALDNNIEPDRNSRNSNNYYLNVDNNSNVN